MNSDSRVVHVGSGSRWGGVLALLAVSACVLALCAVPAAALTGEGVSAAFTIDNRDATPPVTPVVTDDGGYTASANTLHASWTSSDPETGVAEFQYAIGTSPSDPGSGYVVGWTSNGTSAQVTSSGLSLQQGSVYYFYVKARNGVGMWSAAGASNGIKVDTTVPSRPVVMDSGAVQMDVAHLQASWTSSDPDSGIGEYQYAIGTSPADPGSGYVVGWTSTGTSSQVNRTGLSLESGRTYYFYVKAKNGCWQWSPVGTSDGILVDRTVAYYNDFEVGVGQEWSSQARDITPGTAQHPADRFLGQFGNDDVTLSLSDLPAHTTVSVTWDLYLIRSWDGNQAKLPCLDYVTGPDVWDLQADNARTLLHTTFSNVENWMGGYCPPETHPQAYPGTYPDASNAPHTGALEVNTLGYEFTAVKTESMDSVYRITRTFPHDSSQLSLDFRAQGLGDLNDEAWGLDRVTVRALVDTTPPSTPLVTDDGAAVTQGSPLHAVWTASDQESGIVEYMYAVGTAPKDPGVGYVVSWTTSGAATSATVSAVPMQRGVTYYWYVKAKNAAGLWSNAGVSDGIIATDPTPPAIPVVTDDGQYTTIASVLHASWSSSDPESGVAEYQYAIGRSQADPGSGYVTGWTSAGTSMEATSTGLSLQEGGTYYFYVKARNGDGLWSQVGVSDGILVDSTVPSTPVVTDNGAFATSSAQVQIAWSASDAVSGIAEYRYAVGTSAVYPGDGNVPGWVSAGLSAGVTGGALSLQPGRCYYFYVKARNGAGLWSNAGVSDGIMVVSATPVSAGEAKGLPDGTAAGLSGMVVTAPATSLSGRMYVETPDRSSGIAVETSAAYVEGDVLDVAGTLATAGNGERTITVPLFQQVGREKTIRPPVLPMKSVGSRAFLGAGTAVGQRGITGPDGCNLSTIGLLIRVSGLVTDLDSSYVYVNDGSWPAYATGLRVERTYAPPDLQVGDYIGVTGISSLRWTGASYQMLLRPRYITDFVRP